MNTEFNYLYRDGANYKNGGSVIFSGLPDDDLRSRLTEALNEETGFIADQIGIPNVFLWEEGVNYDEGEIPPIAKPNERGAYAITDDDHCLHEFDSAEPTAKPATDPRTFEEFVEAVEAASKIGWDLFTPGDDREQKTRGRSM